jgi:glycosyltransferase involved in cell wall biosynthesis
MPVLNQIAHNTAAGPHHKSASEAEAAPDHPAVRLIAFYLPQFHPIPENDAWWGSGFTEWSNVSRAAPRFAGHIQPRLPADLGFYDLRNPEVLRRQAALARRYGIHGFCFHYYWFHGRRLLERPLELLLEHPDIDLPFCINWANENWTRRWDGLDQEILVPQSHDAEDDIAFVRSLVPAMRDPRYIRIDGRPLLMIYRPGLLPDPPATVRRWRAELARAGVGNPYVLMAQGFGDFDPRPHGVDASVEFPPHKVAVGLPNITGQLAMLDPQFQGHVVDYDDVQSRTFALPKPPYRQFHGVCPSWDNEARKPGRGFVMAGSNPVKYARWLETACRGALETERPDERLVFINAWNEWAEGAYLEPDRHYGHAFLAATARVLRGLDQPPGKPVSATPSRIALISHDAHPHGAQFIALSVARTLVQEHDLSLEILLGGSGSLEPQFRAVSRTELVPGNFADPGAWRAVATRLAQSGYTAVISNTVVSAQALPALHEAGLRTILLVHELPSLIRQYRLERAAASIAELADVVVFPSGYVRDRFLEVSGPIRGRVMLMHQAPYASILSGAERDEARRRRRRELGIADHQRIVLGAGYGDVRKGLDLWPLLAKRVLEMFADAVFVWVGRVEPNLHHWLLHDLAACGLTERVRLLGHTDDVASVFAAADLYALTSREDPFPSVVLEAMAYGLPLVVFEGGGGIADTVRAAGGACVSYADVEAMAREIAKLFADPAASEAMGRALLTAARDFRWSDYATKLLDLVAGHGPSVSVIVPNYNYGRYLRLRMQSIWAQTARPLEIIVLDDASTDDSAAVIDALNRESPVPIRVVRNDTNSGAVSWQWARGVELARGDLVWIAEADDVAEPGFLAAVMQPFADPEVVLAYSESRMIDENGTVLAESYADYVRDVDPVLWSRDYCRSGSEEIAKALAIKNTIPNASAAVFSRDALAAVLRDHLEAMAQLRNAADWLCYIHLLKRGKIAFVARSLNNHRRHPGSVTIAAANRRHLDEIGAMQALAASVVRVSPQIAAAARQYHSKIAAQFGLSGEKVE